MVIILLPPAPLRPGGLELHNVRRTGDCRGCRRRSTLRRTSHRSSQISGRKAGSGIRFRPGMRVFSEQRLADRHTIRHAKTGCDFEVRRSPGVVKADQGRREKCCGTERFMRRTEPPAAGDSRSQIVAELNFFVGVHDARRTHNHPQNRGCDISFTIPIRSLSERSRMAGWTADCAVSAMKGGEERHATDLHLVLHL
jgi:hypothetical protein